MRNDLYIVPILGTIDLVPILGTKCKVECLQYSFDKDEDRKNMLGFLLSGCLSIAENIICVRNEARRCH